MSKITKRIYEEMAELDKYVERNEKNIKELKGAYERAVNINKNFTDRIKAMEKEVFDLEKGMSGIRRVWDTYPSLYNEE